MALIGLKRPIIRRNIPVNKYLLVPFFSKAVSPFKQQFEVKAVGKAFDEGP